MATNRIDERIIPFLDIELDLIDKTISRLDTQIQTSKNFCITLWVTWMGWFVSQQIKHVNCENYGLAILTSAIFPIIFWLVDYQFRKALLLCSRRQNLISLYLNYIISVNSEKLLKFPILDPLGDLYCYNIRDFILQANFESQGTEKKKKDKKDNAKDEQLPTKSLLQIMFYKEAKWFYPLPILVSIITGLVIFFNR